MGVPLAHKKNGFGMYDAISNISAMHVHGHTHARTLRTVTDMRNSSSMDGPANATHHERTRGEEGGSEENPEWADEEERGLEAGDCSTPVVEWLAGEKRDGRLIGDRWGGRPAGEFYASSR